jgi:hypothetical protein
MRFQSAFMLMTVQFFSLATANSASLKVPFFSSVLQIPLIEFLRRRAKRA